MKLIVWNEGVWVPGKYPDSNGTKHEVKRVVFKSIDDGDDRSFFLNLDRKAPDNVSMWEPYIKKGNVLDVTLMPKGGYVTNEVTINKFEPFKVDKNVTKQENK